MKTHHKLLLFLGLVAVLFGGRWLWFYRGSYAPPDIPEIDESQIAPFLVEYELFEDQPSGGEGRVVIDLAHANNLEVNDLAPLRDRLEARGVTIEAFDGFYVTLEDELRSATALLVMAPTVSFTAAERDAVVDFVEDGGRLFLVADPTRPVPEEAEEEFLDLLSIFFPTSAVPAINSLANAFGVVYVDDYLYNLDDNEGNYRNVQFTIFDEEHPLTEDLETVVFFAAHSLRSDDLPLIVGDGHTRSPVRSGETGLAAATLTADERVLALGDVTFLTAPYHTIADNDRFLSHIADWLAVDGRARDELEDFPYLFEQPVDLVQASGDLLDPQLIARSTELQEFFEQAGLSLDVREEADPAHDVLYVGMFEDLELVRDYLTAAGVTIRTAEDEGEGVTPGEEGGEGETVEEEEELPLEGGPGIIEVETLGTVGLKGTTLFVVDRSADRVVVIVLAEDSAAVANAIERLIFYNLSGCVEVDSVTLCSTGEAQDGLDLDLDADEEPASEEAEAGRIFVLSDDGRSDGVRTGAAEFEAILGESYDVTLWSVSQDGVPTGDDLDGYEAYIIDSGDYAFDEGAAVLAVLGAIERGGVMLIGAQPLPLSDEDLAPIEDLAVADPAHPLAAGFPSDAVFALLPSESGIPAAVLSGEGDGEETQVAFTRGPASPESGVPALVTALQGDDADGADRLIVATFASYRLPEDARRTLALNAAEWLMGLDS